MSCRSTSSTTFASTSPLNPPKLKAKTKPIIQYSVVVRNVHPDHILLSQLSILSPVGIAIIDVTEV